MQMLSRDETKHVSFVGFGGFGLKQVLGLGAQDYNIGHEGEDSPPRTMHVRRREPRRLRTASDVHGSSARIRGLGWA